MKKLMAVVALVALAVLNVTAATSFRPATEQEKAHYGATYVAEVSYSDLSTTTTNVVETNTLFTAVSNTVVELKYAIVDVPFASDRGYTESMTVTVGDASDVDRFMLSTQVAKESAYYRAIKGRTAWNSDAATNVAFAYGFTTYTSSVPVRAYFTPNAEDATGGQVRGKIRFYFANFP